MDPAFLGGQETSSKISIKSRKRAVSKVDKPSVNAKNPKRASRPQKEGKSLYALKPTNQDLSKKLGQSKSISRAQQSAPTVDKEYNPNVEEHFIFPCQAANVGVELSAQTMRKLDAFRYDPVSEAHARKQDDREDENSHLSEKLTCRDRSKSSRAHPVNFSEEGSIIRADQRNDQAGEDEGVSRSPTDIVFSGALTAGKSFRTPHPTSLPISSDDVKQEERECSAVALEFLERKDLFGIYQDDILDKAVATVDNDVDPPYPWSSTNLLEPSTTEPTTTVLIQDQISESSYDEFSIEGDEVERLLKSPVLHKTFVSPSSPQLPFDGKSQTGEEYDLLLQSPKPSSRMGVYAPAKHDQFSSIEGQTTLDIVSSPCFKPLSSYSLKSSSETARNANLPIVDSTHFSDEDFFSEEDEQDLLALAAESMDNVVNVTSLQISNTSPSPKLQWNAPTYYNPTQSSWTSDKARSPQKAQTEPASSTLEVTIAPHVVSFDASGRPVPFARAGFPNPVIDRSPIPGFSSSSILRVCFRVGEALNVASQASRSGIDTIIELYSRVTYSERDANGLKQYFQFADLFQSERPPFLDGSYDTWKGVELWDHGARAFLGERGKGKMARVLGRIKRDVRGGTWRMLVMSIWVATWEDVGLMKGTVCA